MFPMRKLFSQFRQALAANLPLFFAVLSLAVFSSCNRCRENKKDAFDRSLFARDSALCETDSLSIETFSAKYRILDTITRELHRFYRERAYRSAWTNNRGVNEYAGNFLNLLNQQKADTAGSSKLKRLGNLYRQMLSETSLSCNDTLLRDIEVLLSATFFEYARRSWAGMSDEVSRQVDWFIIRNRMNYSQLLHDFLENRKLNEPVYRQFGLLKGWLEKYAEIERSGRWPELEHTVLSGITPGDTGAAVRDLRMLLSLTGDLPKNTAGNSFDDQLRRGLISFQYRHGLDTIGLINEATAEAIAVPLRDRIAQIIINMERSRWVPSEVKGSYVVVNIPQFRMHVYEDDDLLWSSNVIVGKSNPVNKTVIFNDSIEMIVFNPYWNIPLNILRSEILPEVKKHKKYLKEKNMEVVDSKGAVIDPKDIDWDKYTNSFPYIIRELPGPENSLGKVKFLFPNPYDIYMHDSPARSLFSETDRMFSHGCIRISEPERFAAHLLRDHPAWPPEKIRKAMEGDTEIYVKLRKKVPVFIAYFTAWVDRNGRICFGRDIYGHDEAMRRLLFVN